MDATSAAGLRDDVRTGVIGAIIDPAFEEDGEYGGMRGGPGNGWDYSWGSNRAQSQYGANLLMARHLGVTGDHSDAERAVKHMHYMLGLDRSTWST